MSKFLHVYISKGEGVFLDIGWDMYMKLLEQLLNRSALFIEFTAKEHHKPLALSLFRPAYYLEYIIALACSRD